MSNVLNDDKRNQVVALGQVGWSLRQIQKATGVRRETAAGYLKAAGIPVFGPGRRGNKPPPDSKRAIPVTTDSKAESAPAIIPPDSSESKPAIEATTDFGGTIEAVSTTSSACEPYNSFVRHYLERVADPPVSLRQVDPLIRQLTLYRDLIAEKTKETDEK